MLSYTPAPSLRSSNTNLLTVWCAHTSLGAHSFSVAPNSLSPALCSCDCPTLSPGTSRLITSSKPFYSPRYLPLCTSDSALADIVRVYKFYLLAYLLHFVVHYSCFMCSILCDVQTFNVQSNECSYILNIWHKLNVFQPYFLSKSVLFSF